jgi:MYXO-CTERM domain-containing protein
LRTSGDGLARAKAALAPAIFIGLAAAAVSRPAPARAAVVEPNGISVPATVDNGETTLQAYFTAQGENINAVNDAATDPGAFLPLCDFQATLVLSQSGAQAGIAWYNTAAGATGSPANVYQIGGFPLTVGMTITSTDVRSDPNYANGLIGFVLMKKLDGVNLSRVYYSEYGRNANCTACTGPGMTPGYWKMALAYRSTKYPNSYYLAFEDWEGADSMSWQGNDGDFNDKVFRIDGVICQGGGELCDTGMQGVCAQGVTECQVGAGITCKPAIRPSAEKCDNLDNDCNGMVDDGDGLCTQANTVCSKGVCIPKCDDSEFPCAIGLKCDTDGLCKDPRCAAMDCLAGQVCQNGACVGGCTGVMCPLGQVCQLGVCVDPCAGVSCPGEVCDKGACVTACTCRACDAGQICVTGGPLDGHCVDSGCDAMTCPAGTVCSKGSCRDACTGAICPGGQGCHNGVCDPVPPATPTGMGGNGGSGTSGAGGFVITGRGGAVGTGGSVGASGSAGAGAVTGAGGATGTGATAGSAGDAPRGRGGTCACEVADAPGAGGVLFVVGLLVVLRRRRRSFAISAARPRPCAGKMSVYVVATGGFTS